MTTLFERSLVLTPKIEASLRSTPRRHCVYVARIVDLEDQPVAFPYPSGTASSVINIGEGESFVKRWLANDKYQHLCELADYLAHQKICGPYGFRVIVDSFALGAGSDHKSIELVLERCFMAACHCPPFFQEVRGTAKKTKPGKETRLYFADHNAATTQDVTASDFAQIEKHVLNYLDDKGKDRWSKFKTAAGSFFHECTNSKNDVSISFSVGKEAAHCTFGNHVVNGTGAELPAGTGKDKHKQKVACFKIIRELAANLSTETHSLTKPSEVNVGQNGNHGTLAITSDGNDFCFTCKNGRSVALDPNGIPK